MPLTKTNVELSYTNVVAGTPIFVDIPAFAVEEIYVKYGASKSYAVSGLDFLVTLDQPDPAPPPTTQYYQFINVTPTANLLAKIALDGTNIIYVGRVLALTTDFSELDAFTRANIDVEFARTNMKLQQLENADVISALPDPRLGNSHDLIRVNGDRSGYEFFVAPGGGDMFRINNLADVVDPVASLANIGGQPINSKLTGLSGMSATPGIMVHDGANAFAKRSIVAGSGVTISNGDGVGGNPTISVTGGTYQPLNNNLTGLAALDVSLGWLVQTAAAVFTKRTLAAGTGVLITNPAGTAGNPSFSVDQAFAPIWTGTHTFGSNAAAAQVNINGPAVSTRQVVFATAGVGRWYLRGANSDAESGGNAGSNFQLSAYSDAGSFLRNDVLINRATGLATFTALAVPAGNLYYGGTDILARANTWTAAQTIQTAAGIGFVVDATAGDATLMIRSTVNNRKQLVYYMGATQRWSVASDNVTESGGNAGSNYGIFCYTDAGAFIGTALGINRATMKADFAGTVNTPTLQIGGTDIFARANTWTADQTIQKNNAVLMVNGTSGYAFIVIQGVAGSIRSIQYKTGPGGTEKWRVGTNANAESGGNSGADFGISAFDDAGASLFNPINITRSTGQVTFGGNVAINAGSLFYGGTELLARANTWTANNTWQGVGTVQTIDGLTGGASLIIRGVSGQTRQFQFYTGSFQHWALQNTGTAETGGNVGSDFTIASFADNGAFLSQNILITRSTGKTTINGGDFNVQAGIIQVSNTQVLGTRKTGWTAATGTATRSTFITGSVTLPVLAEHVKALIDDFMSHGAIG